MNGAIAGSKKFDRKCTRDSTRVDGGSVIDYFAASPNVFARLSSLQVITDYDYSDHNAVSLSWFGTPSTEIELSVPRPIDPSAELRIGPKLWCFIGTLCEEKRNDFVAQIVTDSRLNEITVACLGDSFSQESAEYALRRLHELIRDAWAAC